MSESGDDKFLSEEEEVLSAGGGDSDGESPALGKRSRGDESGDDNFDDGDDMSEGSFKSYSDGSDQSHHSDDEAENEGGTTLAAAGADDDDDIFGDDEVDGVEKKKSKKDKKEKKAKKEKRKKEGKTSMKKPGQKRDGKPKRRRVDVESFFLRETEVADEDEYESEEELGEREEREITQAEAEAIELHRRRMEQTDAFHSKSASEIADDILNRYRTENRSRGEYMSAGGDIMTSEVTHRSLVPGVADPSIWMIRVKLGLEQQLVRSVLFKALKAKTEGKRVGLKSAFCTGSKGYIYLEAFEEVSAREAIAGLSGFYISTFQLVPISDMTSLLNVKVTRMPIKPGQWVRMKRGPLKGDLVKVLSVSEGGDNVVIQAVPRIDYSAKPGEANKSKVRPLQAPFESARLFGAGHHVTRRQFPSTGEMCDYFENNFYSKGFLIKDVKVNLYINDENVTPRLEELTMFRKQGGSGRRRGLDGESDEDDEENDLVSTAGDQQRSIVEELAELQAGTTGKGSGSEKKVSIYRAGDVVQITGGEYAGLKGRVISISDATKLIKLKPLHDQLSMTEIDVEIDLVVKYIQPGSHVKVIDGQFVGETGRVVVVNKADGDHIAAIFTDGIKKEISVNVSFLQVSNEVTIGLNSLEGYELYDFVTLSSNDCGVVVMVGTEQLTILNPSGVEKTLRPMEIRGKANNQSARASSLDNMMNVMKVGDTVTVMEGEFAKKTGTIKHISKATVWLHCDTYFKNSGIFPVRGRSCTLAGASARTRGNEMAPPTGRGGGRGGAGRGRGGRGGGRDEIIGKTVKITRGGYKGHMAVVREKTEAGYSVELAAKFKVVKVPLSDVVEIGDKNGSFVDRSENPAGSVFGMAATPHLLGQTPRLGSSTPMHAAGSETPMGSYTPRGSETPNSSYGYGSQSPHYSAVPQSPYQPSGNDTPYGENSTPHGGSSHSVGGGKKVDVMNWAAGMLAVFTSDEMWGQNCVLLGRVNQDNNMIQVMTLNEQKARTGNTLIVPCTQLKLVDLATKAKAIVVSGQHAGKTGVISLLLRSDVVFSDDDETMFKAWQVALVE